MDTIAFRHLPWMRWIDRSPLNIWWITFLCFCVCYLTLAVAEVLIIQLYPPRSFQPEFFFNDLVRDSLGGPGCLFLVLYCCREAQQDLISLENFDKQLVTNNQLSGSRLTTWVTLVLAALLIIGLMSENTGLGLGFYNYVLQGDIYVIARLLVWSVWGLFGATFFVSLLNQVNTLLDATKKLRIDLLNIDEYSLLANPLVRNFMLTIVLWCFYVILRAWVPEYEITEFDDRFLMVFIISTLLLLIPFVLPLLSIASRIRVAKEEEIKLIKKAYAGDMKAMYSSSVNRHADNLSVSDLITYEQMVRNIQEVPIGPHVRKIILFGLLPPASWVLAGLVETIVSSTLR